MTTINPFISQTAHDYDLSYDIVEGYYNKFGASLIFYEKLEEHLKSIS